MSSPIASAIYVDCLLPLKEGYPLYRPDPHKRLPRPYRDVGICIGDVGILRRDGIFDFLFNICRSSSSPNNPVNTHDFPQDHQLLSIGEVLEMSEWISRETPYLANGRSEQTRFNAEAAVTVIGCVIRYTLVPCLSNELLR